MYKTDQSLSVIAWHSCSMKFDMNSTVEIDCCRNVGMTSFMKVTRFSNEIAYNLHNAGFLDSSDTAKNLMTDDGYFNFCVPFSILLGFCENYKRVVINACHKLILIRARNDNNYIVHREIQQQSRIVDT